MSSEKKRTYAFLAPDGFDHVLQEELEWRKISYQNHGRLFISEDQSRPSFVQDLWEDVSEYSFESISKAQNHLRTLGSKWAHFSLSNHRRGELILEKLSTPRKKLFERFEEMPKQQLHYFSLLESNRLLVGKGRSPQVFGDTFFNEDHMNPPSRAYLKLWEVFTVHLKPPIKNSLVMDLGSCPGGWTWVLQQLGTKVVSVDKAPLAPSVLKLEGVTSLQESAFGLRPDEMKERFGKVDWFFSDIICYPERLYELVKKWIDSGVVSNFVCTLKFQGKTDFKSLDQFLAIPGSEVVHLTCNKHELTWLYCDQTRSRIITN